MSLQAGERKAVRRLQNAASQKVEQHPGRRPPKCADIAPDIWSHPRRRLSVNTTKYSPWFFDAHIRAFPRAV
jgi:hypothetical protein